MSELDRDILLEILGVLTNSTVKRQELRGSTSIGQSLNIGSFQPTVLLSSIGIIPVLGGLLSGLSLQDNNQHGEKSARVLFVDLEECFDQKYDCDFRNRKEDFECCRSGELYRRPGGYYRFALKVLDKYPGGNDWLGPDGWRAHSAPGEWPVSFHGTNIENAKRITGLNYRAGDGDVYGTGIYSTPDIEIAEYYSMQKTFQSETNGKMYTVIMQNRINPKKRIKIKEKKDYWLISVPDESTPDEEREIVESSIRPYGILIKEVN